MSDLRKLYKMQESVYHGQVYHVNDDKLSPGYDVPKLTDWARDNIDVGQIPLNKLNMSRSDECHGSKEFKAHASKVNYEEFPIVVVRLHPTKELQIADGNHRAWKALDSGESHIHGYVIDEMDLPDEAIVLAGTDDDMQ